jgi:hypothetical protein
MHKYLRPLLLAVALACSASCAVGIRVYDEPYQDYHRWNQREERAYREYLVEQRREYREFARLERREQDEYWAWRHHHRDAGRNRDRDRDRDRRDRR